MMNQWVDTLELDETVRATIKDAAKKTHWTLQTSIYSEGC